MNIQHVIDLLNRAELYEESSAVLAMVGQNKELLEALKLSRAYIAVRCGTPDQEDRGADQYLIALCAELDEVITKAEATE